MSTPPVEPVIRVHYQAPVAEGKGLLFETYVPLTMPKHDIDLVVDKLRCIAERQEAIVKVAILRKQLAAEDTHLVALKQDLLAARDRSVERWHQSGRKGEFRPTEPERQHVANTESSIAAREHQIKVLKGEYDHYIALVEGRFDNAPVSSHKE